ncbi:hypothetical protein MKW98_023805, partial [Papaver atlanticum]
MWRIIGSSMEGFCKSQKKQLQSLLFSNQTLLILPLHQKSNLHYHFTTRWLVKTQYMVLSVKWEEEPAVIFLLVPL